MVIDALVGLQEATFFVQNKPVLHSINWALHPGECWAVAGPVGAGKTSFLRAIAGQLMTRSGSVTYSHHRAVEQPLYLWLRQNIALVSFKEDSWQFSYSGHFYQQRYHATMSDEAPSLREFIQLPNTSQAVSIVQRLGLEPLLDLSFLKLSNGQTRKARIAKALLQQPIVLLLDNPFVGLDKAICQELTDWLGGLIGNGLTLVIAVDAEIIPSFVTHIIAINQGYISWVGPKERFDTTPPQETHEQFLFNLLPKPNVDFDTAFCLQNVTVRYGDRLILNDLNWTVQAGEKWALLGPNGSGKSVLLSLLYGDHPQAYANDVQVFGQRRGHWSAAGGQSIWDVKRRIGFVSPELHLYFPNHLTARQVALTALTDTLTVPNRVLPDTDTHINNLFAYFNIKHLQDRRFGTLSTGEQRTVLLIRALVKNAPVLLLDEPFQALDSFTIQRARRLLSNLSDSHTLLFITHDLSELPDCVERVFELPSGKQTKRE